MTLVNIFTKIEITFFEFSSENCNMKNNKKQLTIKALSGVFSFMIYSFLACAILLAGYTVINKKGNQEGVALFNYQFRTVLTNSMAENELTNVDDYKIKSFSPNTMLVIQTVPILQEDKEDWYSKLKVGDVLTFKYVYVRQETITHRITKITEKKNGGYVIELKGDNVMGRATSNVQVIDTSLVDSPNYVIGKVVKTSKVIGVLVNQMQKPLVMVISVIVPTCVIILYEFAKLIRIKSLNQVKNLQEQIAKKEEEIKILKKQLGNI